MDNHFVFFLSQRCIDKPLRDSVLYDVALDWNKKKCHWNDLIAKNSKKCEKEGKYVDNFNQK